MMKKGLKFATAFAKIAPALIFICTMGLGYIAYRLYKRIKINRQVAAYRQTVVETATGDTVSLKMAAAEIHDAFYNNDWFGWTENEDEAIKVIRSLPLSAGKDVAFEYAKIDGKDLYSDVKKYLTAEDYQSVKKWFNN